MPNIYQLARQFRGDLLANERQASSAMVQAYGQSWTGIKARLDDVTAQIDAARKQGQTVSASWLLRQERYKALMQQTEAEIARFARFADQSVTRGQAAAVQAAAAQARQLTMAGLGEGAEKIVSTWNALPADAIENLVGVLQNGSPLASLFDSFGPESKAILEKSLLTGIAAGQGAAAIARSARQGLGGNLTRALTISRTETLRAYREASIQSYAANEDVVSGWIWAASLSARTCAMCIAMNGTLHESGESFGSHPNCRCVPIPHTKSWEDLGIESAEETQADIEPGEDWFAAQTEETQRQILGPAKLEAWQSGAITLKDLIGYRDDANWGPIRWERPLKSAIEEAGSRSRQAEHAPPERTAPQRAQTPVAAGYSGLPRSGRFKAVIDRALAAIDRVHKDGELPVIPVKINSARTNNGSFVRARSGKSREVTLSRNGDTPELTFCHETGHFLDWEVLGNRGQFGSESPGMDAVMHCIEQSGAAQSLTALLGQNTVRLDVNGRSVLYPVDKTYIRYLLDGREQWARAYAQYIAEKSGDTNLLAQLAKLTEQNPGILYYARQWGTEDFAPIAKAIDKLFVSKGWK